MIPTGMESWTTRDLVEVAILAAAIYALLRLLGKTRGAGMVRGLGLLVLGFFLIAQVIIASFDLTVLSRVLDYLLTTILFGLLVVFHPELRRGLMVLGRYRFLRFLVEEPATLLVDKLADAVQEMSKDSVGALIAIEREMSLTAYSETGAKLDAEVTSLLIQTIFYKHTPLHDGAVILREGRVAAAACQLPMSSSLGQSGVHPQGGRPASLLAQHLGMRHRAGLCLSEETDAVLIIVSEESGRISFAAGGILETVEPDRFRSRLAELLEERPKPDREPAVRKAA